MLALVVSFGCSHSVNDTSVAEDSPAESGPGEDDLDGDGFGEDDCDDLNPSVHPGADEVPYDGIDQDCDSEDLTDVDSDGYDAAAADGTDCDDNDATIHPAAEDVPYDGIDQDCDGSDLTDADGDGWESSVVGGADCDDLDPAVSPDATELSETYRDENCDGLADWDVMTTWEADVLWEGNVIDFDESQSLWGLGEYGIGVIPDVDGDGVRDIAASAGLGLAILPSDVDYGGYGLDSAWTVVYGNDGQEPWGLLNVFRPGTIPDVDGDGLEDVLVSAAGTRNGKNANGVFILSSADLATGSPLNGADAFASVFSLEQAGSGESSAYAVVDINGDGIEELILGEHWANGNYGRVNVVDWSQLTGGGVQFMSDAEAVVETDEANYLGFEIAVLPDLQGTGNASVAIATQDRLYVVEADRLEDGDFVEDLATTTVLYWTQDYPEYGGGRLPHSTVPLEDLDGDGHAEVAFYDESATLLVDGQAWGGRVDVFTDLWAGGTTNYYEANGRIVSSSSSSSGIVGIARGNFGGTQPDLVVCGADGISFLAPSDIPTTGLLDLAGWTRGIENDGAWLCYRNYSGPNVVAEDLDGDGFDELIAHDPHVGIELDAGEHTDQGVIGIFYNRHP